MFLEVDLEYSKELCKLHIDYCLAADKTKTKREILTDYQLKIPDLNNVPIGKVKNSVPHLFDKK